MYGGLELAEAVKLGDGLAGVTNRQANPYLANRGIKFNIPLDARTPPIPRKLSGQDEFIPLQCYRDVEHGFWSGISIRWPAIATIRSHCEREPVSLPGPGARISEHGARRRARPVFNPTNSTWSTVTHITMTMDEKIAFCGR